MAWNRQAVGSAVLTVYIEGDGLAWLNPHTASEDPTPVNPVALKMAIQDVGPSAYLGRLCQFGRRLSEGDCPSMYWTSHRYSKAVIRASQYELDRLKVLTGTHSVRLVGYSGGAAIALLLASERADVLSVTTVAGNLDTDAWAKLLKLEPLWGSLNPAHRHAALVGIPQLHWVGGKDGVIPPEISAGYAAHFPAGNRPPVRIMEDFDHHCCWDTQWGKMQKIPDALLHR